MKLSEFTDHQKQLATLTRDAKVEEAAKLMKKARCGNVIIEEDRKPVGILTDRDIVLDLVAKGKSPSKITVGELMSKEPVVLEESQTGSMALAAMTANGVSRVVVINSKKEASGVVTADHILRYVSEELSMLASLSEQMHDREEKTRAA